MLIEGLLEAGAKVQAHDPEAMPNIRQVYGDRIAFGDKPMDVIRGADALVINTEWKDYHRPNWDTVAEGMKAKLVFDGRNLYDTAYMAGRGFTYYSVGRPPVRPE